MRRRRRLRESCRNNLRISVWIHVGDISVVTDACRMRKRALPHVQAAVANLAISVLRLLGTANLARTVDNLRLHPSSGGQRRHTGAARADRRAAVRLLPEIHSRNRAAYARNGPVGSPADPPVTQGSKPSSKRRSRLADQSIEFG